MSRTRPPCLAGLAGCREHLGAQVTVHTDRSPQKRDIRCRYERARCRRLDAGSQHGLSVLCPPLTMSGCSVAGALAGAPGTTARDRMTMQETASIFFSGPELAGSRMLYPHSLGAGYLRRPVCRGIARYCNTWKPVAFLLPMPPLALPITNQEGRPDSG